MRERETMETDKSGQTRVITALLDLYQDSLGKIRTKVRVTPQSSEGNLY